MMRDLTKLTTLNRKCIEISLESMKKYIDTYLNIDEPSMLLYSDIKQEDFKNLKDMFRD